MIVRTPLCVLLGAVSLLALAPAQGRAESGTAERMKKEAQIPHCVRPLGTVAVKLKKDTQDWWTGEGLASPEVVIKSLVQKSGCFTLVDRGAGMDLAEEERRLAANGTLRAGSNIGRGQVKAVDYIIVPVLLSKNAQSSGSGVGGLLGFIRGVSPIVQVIAGGINMSSKTADVALSFIDVRSGVELATLEGHAKKKDLSWGAGGGGFGTTGLGAIGATGYANTEIGQVIMLAYVEAYTKLVESRGGVIISLPSDASAAAPTATSTTPTVAPAAQASLATIRATTLRQTASTKGKILGSLPAGSVVYPTGVKAEGGKWTQVTDEAGAKGWVSSLSLSAQ